MALRGIATNLMLTRAVAASWPALKTTTTSSFVLEEAAIQEFARLVANNYAKQRRVARVAGVGLTAAAATAAVALAGFGVHRLRKK